MVALATGLALLALALSSFAFVVTWQLVASLKRSADDRAALAQCESDLLIVRGNEEAARIALADATDLINALRERNADERKATEDADTAKILGATGAAVTDVSASVFASMRAESPAGYPLSADGKVRAAVIAAADSAKRRR